MRKSLILALSFFWALSLVSVAQTRPQISRVIHNGTRTLQTGESLDVVLFGEAGCQARFEILGAIRSVPMTEVQRGRYEARYTIPNGLRVERGIVIGYLSRGGLESAQEASQPVTIEMKSGGGDNAPIRGGVQTEPEPNGSTDQVRPTVKVQFPAAVRAQTVRFYMDGIDFTRQIKMNSGNNGFQWPASYNLSEGEHTAHAEATDIRNVKIDHTWKFTVGEDEDDDNSERSERWKNRRFEQFLPQEDASVSTSRPEIGVVFRRDVTNPRLTIDGRDFTAQAQRSSRKISWTPSYNLDSGKHWAEVKAVNKRGREFDYRWEFTVGQAQPQGNITSATFTPTSIKVGEMTTVTARATKGSDLTFDLGTRVRNLVMRADANDPTLYRGTYKAMTGDAGQYPIHVRLKRPDGQYVSRTAGNLVIQEDALKVENIREGMQLPTNFNVIGYSQPGATVTAVVEYQKRDFLGSISGQPARKSFTAVAGADKLFNISVHHGLKPGTSFKLVVSDTAGGEPKTFNLTAK